LLRQRHLDIVGVLVLAGIAVGTVLGLVSGNARLVLIEGSVPTAVFGMLCLGSLRSPRPLIFRFALEFMAPAPRGAGTSRACGAIPDSAMPSGCSRWSGEWLTWPKRPPGWSSSS